MQVFEEQLAYYDPKNPSRPYDETAPDAVIVPIIVEDADPTRTVMAKQLAIEYVQRNFPQTNLSIDRVDGPLMFQEQTPSVILGKGPQGASSVVVLNQEEYLKMAAAQNKGTSTSVRPTYVIYVRVRRLT